LPLVYEIKKKESLKTSLWSGGTTTEIYIYPENALYAGRKFDFRISTAVVEDEESAFTQLPGFKRHIMPLEGSMYLIHENHHEIQLKPFQKDFFHGDWVTKSHGKCTDFNLMLAENFSGNIDIVKSGYVESLRTSGFFGFYMLCDCMAEINLGSGAFEEKLEKGSFLTFPFIGDTVQEICRVKLTGTADNAFAAVKVNVNKEEESK